MVHMISNAHTLSIPFLVLIATVTFVFAGETAANAADIAALQERAQRGDVDAQIDLAEAYMDSGNAADAQNWMLRAAEEGSARAENLLGILYSTRNDPCEALKWFKKAAAQNYAQGLCSLGVSYSQGLCVPKNAAEAAKLYRRAAEMGAVQAQTNLGILYLEGRGIKKDAAEAIKWFRRAAAQDDAVAQMTSEHSLQSTFTFVGWLSLFSLGKAQRLRFDWGSCADCRVKPWDKYIHHNN